MVTVDTRMVGSSDIRKPIILFILSLIVVYFLLAAKGTYIAAKACVEIEENLFLCTDTSVKKLKKTYKYYLDNFGVAQTMSANADEEEMMTIIARSMKEYLKKFIEERGNGEEWLKEKCTNNDPNCLYWAASGECKSNPDYMESDCALACHSCHKLERDEL